MEREVLPDRIWLPFSSHLGARRCSALSRACSAFALGSRAVVFSGPRFGLRDVLVGDRFLVPRGFGRRLNQFDFSQDFAPHGLSLYLAWYGARLSCCSQLLITHIVFYFVQRLRCLQLQAMLLPIRCRSMLPPWVSRLYSFALNEWAPFISAFSVL